MNKQQNEEKNTPDVFKSLLEELNQAGYKLSGNIVVNIYRSGSQHVDRVENQYIGIRPTKVASKDKATAKSKATAPKNAPTSKLTTTAKPTAPKAMPTAKDKTTAKSKATAPKSAPKAKPTTTAKPTAPKAMPTAKDKATAKSKAAAPKSAPKDTTIAPKNAPTPKSTTTANPAPLPDNLRSQLRECLALLMQERFGSEPLLNRQSHWQAVYRILVDKGYCADSDFNGFDSFIRGVMPEVVNKPYTKGSVKMISQTPFVRPFGEWKFDPLIFKTRKPFERMVAVASRFLTLMDEHGLVKKRPNS